MRGGIFHESYQQRPFWWDVYDPNMGHAANAEVPKSARVAIIGAGYAGLAAALELARHGHDSVVLDAEMPGFGGSTRNGGMVSSGVTIGKRYSGTNSQDELKLLLSDASDSFSTIERLIDDEKIDCEWRKTGRAVMAWTPSHRRAMEKKLNGLNEYAQSGARMLTPENQREHIGSDYYYGGMLVDRSAHLHPAKYFAGLMAACARHPSITICGKAPVTKLTRAGNSWRVETARGSVDAGDVIIATNGYTGDLTPKLKARVIPLGSFIIATEEMPEDLAHSILPTDRSAYDTRRVLTYYRMSGDRRRFIFGGRARFGMFDATEIAPILHRQMTDRFPQLKDVKITHAWTGNVAFTFDEIPHMGQMDGMHYALGCNGSGVAMMTYLGTETAKKIAGKSNHRIAFDTDFPGMPLYNGSPWFVPFLGRYLRTRDWLDRTLAR